MHIKRSKMPKTWPLARKKKAQKFIAIPSHAVSQGISLLFILRDLLKIAKTRKEVRYMTLNGLVKVNHKVRKDENFPMSVFDVLSLEKEKLNYKLEIVNKKFKLLKISEKESGNKVIKIIGKKVMNKNRIQMNLGDGSNFITKDKFSVGDSVVLNMKENKVGKILPLKIGAKIEIIIGKHAGEKGKLVNFAGLTRGRNYSIKLNDTEVVLPYKSILVIE
ncbi:MAG: S4 domain-containing protein [Nanoarchaeota archaeon]|nr:S4 domain-containing protein [Nanoarchaeota archaeon]